MKLSIQGINLIKKVSIKFMELGLNRAISLCLVEFKLINIGSTYSLTLILN